MYTLLTLLLTAALVLAFLFATSGVDKTKKLKYLRIAVVFYCIYGIARYFLTDAFDDEIALQGADLFGSFTRWGYYLGYVIIPMAAFFERRVYRNIALCFTLPVAVVCAFGINSYLFYFLDPATDGYLLPEALRIAIHIIELALAAALPILITVVTEHRFDLRSKQDYKSLLMIVPMLMMVMPAYIPQSLFGYTGIDASFFGQLHLFWIAFLFINPFIIYFLFRKKSKEVKYELIVFWSITQVYHSMSVFIRGFKYSRIPLQLCCIAAFFYLAVAITRNRKLFNFCYLANIVGATVAIVLAEFSTEAFTFWNIHYIQEHTLVIMMPILAIALGVFPRIEKTALKDTFKIFNVYFFSCFIIGVVINLICGGYEVDYFYMLDYDIALNYLPFVTFTGLIEIPLGTTSIYPILVITIYVVYIAIFVLFYFFTRGIYRIIDKCRARGARRNETAVAEPQETEAELINA